MGKKPVIAQLTSLRYLAAVLVVLYHYHILAFAAFTKYGAGMFWDHLARYGYAGVSFFFVLSGFILVYSIREGEIAKFNRRAFWTARFARIYPLYAIALLISIPFFTSFLADNSITGLTKAASKIILEFSLLQSWLPLGCGVNCPDWSLSVEAFFYLIFPFLALWLIRRTTRTNLLFALAAWAAALIVPLIYGWSQSAGLPSNPDVLNFVIFNPLLHLPQFFIGAATGIIFIRRPLSPDDLRNHPNLRRLLQMAPPVILAGLILAAVFLNDLSYPLLNNGLLAPLFALLIFSSAAAPSPFTRLLSFRPLVLLGEASYAVYILQYPLAGVWSHILGRSWQASFDSPLKLFIFVAVLSLVAVAAYLLIEKPARKQILGWFTNPPSRHPNVGQNRNPAVKPGKIEEPTPGVHSLGSEK